MNFLQCNCMTKTPEPKFHEPGCPVYLGDRVHQLAKELLSKDEALTILSLKLNMSGEQLEGLVALCGLPLGERLEKLGIKKLGSNVE